MRNLFTLVGGALVISLALVGVGALIFLASGGGPDGRDAGWRGTEAGPTEPEPSSDDPFAGDTLPEEEAASAEASELTCDYLLGDAADDDEYRFVAGGALVNPDPVPVTVRVTVPWTLLGEDPVKTAQRVRLPASSSKDIQIRVPATGDQIDAHQSADGECEPNAEVVG